MYVKFTCNNDFCGCDEEFYRECDNNISEEELNIIAQEILEDEYGFYDPDDRFCNMEDEEEVINYQENCSCFWEEISEEEFLENT